MLTSGMVPALYPDDEREAIIGQVITNFRENPLISSREEKVEVEVERTTQRMGQTFKCQVLGYFIECPVFKFSHDLMHMPASW